MFEALLKRQHTYFRDGHTRPLPFRLSMLQSLYALLDDNESKFIKALYDDFRKPAFEAYGTEIGIVKQEITFIMDHLSDWMKPETVKGSVINFPSQNVIYKEPYGSVLIISPWNYPVQLTLSPLSGALAAGNTAVIKPSEYTPNTSRLLQELIADRFDSEYVSVVTGAVEESEQLLQLPFDYILFTGSPAVGKIIMRAASENLTPVTLELGGKSPCIIGKGADLKVSLRRIFWGKFVNAGQTCVASDYVYVPLDRKEEFFALAEEVIKEFFGEHPHKSSDYARIINEKQYDRLAEILAEDHEYLRIGGKMDPEDRYIEPTLLDVPGWEARSMQEEIFGPILPVLTYEQLDTVITTINDHPKPLACYVFTNDQKTESRVLHEISFGGGAVNDTIAHLGNHHLPFGGVGNSGMGAYHGKYSFDTFSHRKSIMKKSFWPDLPVRYAPYDGNIKWLKKILK